MPSGGRREGAGRRKRTVSELEIMELRKAFHRKAKETGQTVQDLLAEIAYNKCAMEVVSFNQHGRDRKIVHPDIPTKERLRAMELYLGLTITKHSVQEVHNVQTGPTIGLPPIKKPPEEEKYPKVAERSN